jgi:myo-inositol-1(or 4)-monophosphatase
LVFSLPADYSEKLEKLWEVSEGQSPGGVFMQGHLEVLLSLAKRAAQAAAAVHRRAERGRLGVGMKSSAMDLVTTVDLTAERVLVSVIRSARPHDAIIGEEGTSIPGSSGVCWILDPLDGTTNFVYGYPAHAVAVGVEIDGQRVLGVVHDTSHQRVYAGVVGVGAQCDGSPIAAGATADLSQALVGTGFLPDAPVRQLQGEVLRRLLPVVRDVRRSGCPALDLCAVAAGMLDGFYESGLGQWDIAAGAAIAEASGARVVELQSPILPNPLLVVANARLLKALVAVFVETGAAAELTPNTAEPRHAADVIAQWC